MVDHVFTDGAYTPDFMIAALLEIPHSARKD